MNLETFFSLQIISKNKNHIEREMENILKNLCTLMFMNESFFFVLYEKCDPVGIYYYNFVVRNFLQILIKFQLVKYPFVVQKKV